MQEVKMTLVDVEIEDMLVRLLLEAEIDGDGYSLEKSVRLSKWNEEEKKLVEDEAAHEKGMATIKEVFGKDDLSDLATVVGNEYTFFLSDNGQIFFEEPEWYAEKLVLDELWGRVQKPDAKLEGKNSKADIEHVQITKNGVTIFFEVTGKAGKGIHVVTNFRFGSFTADGEFKREFKKKKKQETKLKNLFDVNNIEDLQDLVGEKALIAFEKAPNGSIFVSCSGLDE